MKISIIRVLGTMLLITCSFSIEAAGLIVNDPWVRAAPPVAPVLAAYMILENHSSSDISVVDVRTSLEVNGVGMHRTIMTNGMMSMVPQEFIPVAPHSSTVLEPGSWHIMLVGPKKVPVKGEIVHLTLVLSDGSEQAVAATVRQGKMMMNGEKSHEMKAD